MEEACTRQGTIKFFDPKVLRCFAAHNWPGNVRELRATVEFLVAMSEGKVIKSGDLPPYMQYGIAPERFAARAACKWLLTSLRRA